MSQRTESDYITFEKRVQKELFRHKVIIENEYCQWFQDGNLTLEQVRDFAVQFSVFSNFFLIAQLKKVINAPNLEEMRASKEILANELGVVYNKKENHPKKTDNIGIRDVDEDGSNPALVGIEGSVDGGTFRFRAAHFEWLLHFAEPLGLGFNDMGKARHGSETTMHFMRELDRIYGSEDFNIAVGASFAVENWAAAGFWKDLISGLKKFKSAQKPNLHLGFFTWHDKVESQHAEHTYDELKEIFYYDSFDEDQFIKSGLEMLDGVQIFWDGLNVARKQLPTA